MEPRLIGKIYYVRFTFLREQYRFSLNTSNLKVANKISDQIEAGLRHGVFDSFEPGAQGLQILKHLIAQPGLTPEKALEQMQSRSRHTKLIEAINEYLESCKTEHSEKNYKNEKRVFEDFPKSFNVDFVHQVAPEMIERWRNARIGNPDRPVKKPTVNRELKMLKRFFNQCVEKGYISKSPAQSIKTYKEPERTIRHLSDDEVKKLLEAAPVDLKRVITFLLLTGLRYGELCHLEWSDIDFRHKQVIVQPKANWNPKNFKKRVIPMHPVVFDLLQNVPKNEDSEYLFPDDEGGSAVGGLRNRLYRVFENAKVKGNVKDLRSTFASNAVMSGMPIYTVSKLLGHHDVKITERHYAHLAPDYMGNAITMLQPKWGIPLLTAEAN